VSYQILKEFESRLRSFVKKETGFDAEIHISSLDINDREAAFRTVTSALIRGAFLLHHPVNADHVKACPICDQIIDRHTHGIKGRARDFVSDHLDLIAEARMGGREGR